VGGERANFGKNRKKPDLRRKKKPIFMLRMGGIRSKVRGCLREGMKTLQQGKGEKAS